MQLSTKARYAVRALVELAASSNNKPVKLKDIAQKQDISLKYLEQVMLPLRIGGYVKTLKGSRGGYMLSCIPGEVTLLELIRCVEGSLAPVDCVENPEICKRNNTCAVRGAWVGLNEAICEELSRTTLGELVTKQLALEDY